MFATAGEKRRSALRSLHGNYDEKGDQKITFNWRWCARPLTVVKAFSTDENVLQSGERIVLEQAVRRRRSKPSAKHALKSVENAMHLSHRCVVAR